MNLNIIRLGIIQYKKALQIQESLQLLRMQDKIDDTLILLEHYPVITLGRRGKHSNIKIPEIDLEKQEVNIYEVSRGGDVTYHGPGQLVGYLIFDLRKHGKDIKKFIWKIEEVFISVLKEYGIDSYRDENIYTGVWIGDAKITAIGISVSRWITMHGFSFNINTNLMHYNWINPCGIINKGITSLENIIGEKLDFSRVVDRVIFYFSEIFKLNVVNVNEKEIFEIIKRGENVCR